MDWNKDVDDIFKKIYWYEEGKFDATLEMIVRMNKNNISVKTISKITGLPITKVKNVIMERN